MALITVPIAANGPLSDMPIPCSEPTFVTANSTHEKSVEGVSLKNALDIDRVLADDFQPLENYHWFFLRVNYGRAEKLYNLLKDHADGYLLWMPCQKRIKYEKGKKFESLVPIFKSNLFIYSTEKQAFSLTHHSPETGYPFVDFAYDHTDRNEFGRDHKIRIPFSQMKEFIKAEKVHHPWAYIVPEEQIHFKRGGLVRVTGGTFEGVVGRVARVYGQTRVVITIHGVANYCTAFVSNKNLEPIEKI